MKKYITYIGNHRGLSFQIKQLEAGELPGEYIWYYYIRLKEATTPNFESLWIHPLLDEASVSYQYKETWPAKLYWHGGVTYYAKHGEVPGHRAVEFGCDYSHFLDMQRGYDYTLDEVLCDVITTCNEIAGHLASVSARNLAIT